MILSRIPLKSPLFLAIQGEVAEDLLLGNRGAVSEQFVGQELAAARPPWEPRDLFCWARECRSSNAEVDYLGASGGRIYPVEVKSGATGRLKSMHQFLAEKGTDFGLRFNGDAPSFVKTDFPDGAGARRPFRLLSLPLYLASEARRLVARSAFFAALALSLGLSPSVRAAWTFDSSAKTLSDGTFVLRNVTASGSTLTIGDNKSNANIAGDVDLSSGIAGRSNALARPGGFPYNGLRRKPTPLRGEAFRRPGGNAKDMP